jgi:hypothetical protein
LKKKEFINNLVDNLMVTCIRGVLTSKETGKSTFFFQVPYHDESLFGNRNNNLSTVFFLEREERYQVFDKLVEGLKKRSLEMMDINKIYGRLTIVCYVPTKVVEFKLIPASVTVTVPVSTLSTSSLDKKDERKKEDEKLEEKMASAAKKEEKMASAAKKEEKMASAAEEEDFNQVPKNKMEALNMINRLSELINEHTKNLIAHSMMLSNIDDNFLKRNVEVGKKINQISALIIEHFPDE